ncbi:hypothetical protein [Streptomyces poonensis]|uniref:Uncharacterized protein n=1 Tax=Streptomyces poonensis TaxID=68255 RepID=A0A918QDV6_9ACTN|nr:hypothetical protein [Streptomyces poonensis]GGZ41423.1 hypothetical protein GCM10010365_72660 [Streptomyces poonensis]
MPDKRDETACRVCGVDDGEILWGAHGFPLYVICDCCGTESGIGDDNLTQVRELRGYWVGRGAPWAESHRRPKNWDLLRQIQNIPEEWR